MKFLVTGGLGFIGSALIKRLIAFPDYEVMNLDALTYAGRMSSLREENNHKRYSFIKGNVCDHVIVNELLNEYKPDVIMNLAAETHVDRSIKGSKVFLQTNIIGTHVLLEAAKAYWQMLSPRKKELFRFVHVSTDEVFGDIGETGCAADELTRYAPNSPYSASKASADFLVRAWSKTYGLPSIITNCSNNYGPRQYPEKLIPLMISNALLGRPLPVYGDGNQIRDWLYVDDHAEALILVSCKGRPGESYNIGGNNQYKNIDVVHTLCTLLDNKVLRLPKNVKSHRELISFVEDRAGHDQRYAINCSKIKRELGWVPTTNFENGLEATVDWYLENPDWLSKDVDGDF